jgi:GABA permease
MPRYLIVANRSLAGPTLVEEVVARNAADAASVFHVVVPATRDHHGTAWTEGQAIAHARAALDGATKRFADAGVPVTGEVGDENPMLAVGDVLRREAFDEIIVSTLPAGPSRWLKRDLPRRLEREYELPVTHVIAQFEPAG